VSRSYPKILRNRKRRIQRRLDPERRWSDQAEPMMKASNIHYEMAEKARAVNCGGIGAIHLMVNKLGLRQEIDSRLHLLKKHLPYHESDHVLNLTYNALLEGIRLEDIELRRNDEGFLDGLGAQRIPDPTTSGDFTRRFAPADILALMEITNTVRQRVWNQQPKGFLREVFIDTDGTIAPTFGECKGGMALSYKGIWGYAPLVVSLANTNEVLYLVNRPGNVVSHEGCVPWIDRAIKLVAPHAGQITLRGDTDFTLTGELDRWDEQGIKFIFGMDAHPKVVNLAEAVSERAWKPLERLPRYEIATTARRKPERVKESIVRFKGYENKVLVGEDIAEIEYQPRKCSRPYRLVIVRKNISVQKGERTLFDEIRYFFYLTNRADYAPEQIVSLANGRCHQENVTPAAQKWGQRHAHAGGRFAEQLGLYGDDLPGLESEGVVRAAPARWSTRSGADQDGVPALFARHRFIARPDRAHRPTCHLPHHELQQLAERPLRGLGASAEARCHLAKKKPIRLPPLQLVST
jgi:Transposase DDE domain group 1